MSIINYSDIQEKLNNTDFSSFPKLNISVLRNIMLEPIEPYLQYLAYKSGFYCKVEFGDYDNIFQEAVGGKSKLLNSDTDIVLVFMFLDSLSWSLSRRFSSLSDDEIQDEIVRIKKIINNIIDGLAMQTDAMILWHSLELPIYPNLGIRDSQTNDGQINSIKIINDFLCNKLYKTSNAFFVDMNLCLARVGAKLFYDQRYWHIGRAPYTRNALYEIAFEDYKYIRSLKGENKKCLVLDCDNTLWGGIIGEDGLSGIKLSKTHPGSAFYEFQQEILNLYNRGVILAICSKNNEDDVYSVFNEHPNMLLKQKNIAVAYINWDDKVLNLRRIANDLNISLNSMVFIEDSEFEINLVRGELPDVETIQLPKLEPGIYRNLLASCGFFDMLTITDEDKKRGQMYRSNVRRNQFKEKMTNLKNYYYSLDMVVYIHFADKLSLPRIAQQTQKTNQFNLTTQRYSEKDIKKKVDKDNWDVIYIKLSDKFGDSGIVGTCILKYVDNEAIIDTFLLSCRVIGRGVEKIFLSEVLNLLKIRGVDFAIGEYSPTKKNKQVEFFYKNQGFDEFNSHSKKRNRKFVFDLNKKVIKKPDYFKEIITSIGESNE